MLRRRMASVPLAALCCGLAAAQAQKDPDLIDDVQPPNFRLEGGDDAYCYDLATSIPPIGEISTTLEIQCPAGTIDDLDLLVQINHTWVGDLSATLTKQGRGSATVFDRPGHPESTFGCAGNDIDAIIDDEAAKPIEDECADSVPTIQGEFIGGDPADDRLMASWDGEELCGTWTLTVADAAGGDSGFIKQWCLTAGPPDEPGDGAGDGGGDGVPSTTGMGAAVILLMLLGAGSYFRRRQTKG